MPSIARLASTTAVLGAAALLVPSPSAHAAGTCTLNAPSAIRVSAPAQAVPISFSGSCLTDPAASTAVWDLTDPRGQSFDFAAWSKSDPATESFPWYDDDQLGSYTWKPHAVQNADGQRLDYTQNTVKSDVRVGSWATLNAGRSGAKTVLNVTATRYAYSLHTNVRWGSATGIIQWREPGSATWQNLKNVSTASNGTYSYAYTTSQKREYRVAIFSKPTIWWAHSAAASA